MDIRIAPQALEWLQDKGNQITLEPISGGGGASAGGAQAAPGAPQGRGYNQYDVDGVRVFVHPSLAQVAAMVLVDLGGFWKMRWLRVSGAAPLSACSFGSLWRKDMAMLEVTPSAGDAVREYLSSHGLDSAIRVTLEGGGGAGPSWQLVLDEPQNNDERLQIGDLLFVIDRRLAAETGHIKIDYLDQGVYSGFRIIPAEEPKVDTGSACACSCGLLRPGSSTTPLRRARAHNRPSLAGAA